MELFETLLCGLLVVVGLTMTAGTVLSHSTHPHWFVRLWDFPRAQIAAIVLFVSAAFWAFCNPAGFWGWAFLVTMGATLAWQTAWILPYTRLSRQQVKDADSAGDATEVAPADTIRLVASNVLQENDQYEHWLHVIRSADPDVILAVEVDDHWMEALESLTDEYPHAVRMPLDNYYGMVLFSRLPFSETDVQCRVQDDVPSMRVVVETPGGRRFVLYGVHPRPPEPVRDQDAVPRDAELVLVGREAREETQPLVVAGDFNDVAWSHTTRLFQELSGLLDPRVGRGLFSTFPARWPLMRYPLDHIFHSQHFQLERLTRLENVGSDHLPILAVLSLQTHPPEEQSEMEADGKTEAEAQARVEQAAEDEEADRV